MPRRAVTHQEAEDPTPLRRREQVVGTAGGQVVGQGGPGCGTGAGDLLGTEAAARHEQLVLVRRPFLPEQRQVAGAVGHRAEEGMDVGRLARRPQRRVVPSHGVEPRQARAASASAQRPMCLPSSAIWLLTSTVRGSLSMAVARVSAVQRSSVSTESAIDQPA